jgi:hypothetical protein
LSADFDSIRDVVKNLASEVENVNSLHGQVKTDDTLASVLPDKVNQLKLEWVIRI